LAFWRRTIPLNLPVSKGDPFVFAFVTVRVRYPFPDPDAPALKRRGTDTTRAFRLSRLEAAIYESLTTYAVYLLAPWTAPFGYSTENSNTPDESIITGEPFEAETSAKLS